MEDFTGFQIKFPISERDLELREIAMPVVSGMIYPGSSGRARG